MRAANFKSWRRAAGEPVGEPVTDLAPSISEPTETGTGSKVSPKKCNEPFGASVEIKARQFKVTFTVLSNKSNLPFELLPLLYRDYLLHGRLPLL